ncbi:MAG: FliI/YscN family ATPase [Alphaproteobacteria bacterium]|nr:FliI/YscN family ATPase [Alphaproteobacteria bacterium]MBU1277693.1 FliI/YscN family ATPase [Alphaproteobacteria bacterium]MBU1574250.1 FliI/YscN family ATPase [Alphaproteobacteria bacterium]MBU1827457.1 FliI/YscN family ATPase [Alphaproteobacteria bacterium]MBU2077097.1 FliI/YscN family ATPase [Alphaproteobacteria bacterium]
MNSIGFEMLLSEIASVKPVHSVGRVIEVSRGVLTVSGLSEIAALGDLVEIGHGTQIRRGEILQLDKTSVTVLPDGGPDGLSIGDPVAHIGKNHISPDDMWIGRVIDPFGQPLDGKPILQGNKPRALRGKPMNPTERRALGKRLETGLAVFNTLLPIVRGQRIGLFAGSGVGKSTLLAKLATGLEADVVVIAMVGERGREVREFIDRVLGPAGMKRSVIVAATSDQSPMVRRRCAWTAMSVAEHFRDKGKQVLFLADSVTRFAESHREVALATGESSSLRGFPPSTSHLITSLCERAGPGIGDAGDITAVFSVLVAGSDMEEPIADILRGVLDGHIVLDRQIAERGRFPAIDLLRSVSRALPHAASDKENELISRARRLLGVFDRSEMMIQAGLYTTGTDPMIDEAIETWPRLDHFLAQSEPNGVQASFERLEACFTPVKAAR